MRAHGGTGYTFRRLPAQTGRCPPAQNGDAAVSFRVRLPREAEADPERVVDFVLAWKLARVRGDLELAGQAIVAIRAGVATLKSSPFIFRKAGQSPFLRGLMVSFGHSGYVAIFEIVDPPDVVVSTMRQPLEDDYHWSDG